MAIRNDSLMVIPGSITGTNEIYPSTQATPYFEVRLVRPQHSVQHLMLALWLRSHELR